MYHPPQYYEKNFKSPTSHTVTSELSARDHYTFLGYVLLVEYIYSWNYYLFMLQRIAFSFLTFSCDTEIEFLRITFSFRSYGLRLQITFSVWCIWDSTTIWISLWLKNVLYPTHLHHWLKLLHGPRSHQMFWILYGYEFKMLERCIKSFLRLWKVFMLMKSPRVKKKAYWNWMPS